MAVARLHAPFDMPRAGIMAVICSTPIDLCQYEDRRIHVRGINIPPELRAFASCGRKTDADKEAAITAKVEAATVL